MKVLDIYEIEKTNLIDNAPVKLDIDIETEGKIYNVYMEGEIYAQFTHTEESADTPAYTEVTKLEAEITCIEVTNEGGKRLPLFGTPFHQSNKNLEDLLIQHCFEG